MQRGQAVQAGHTVELALPEAVESVVESETAAVSSQCNLSIPLSR